MQQENNPMHWKQKLEDTGALSAGLSFDKGAGWNKVQQRLQKKPKRRKAVLYWVAAACLLPLLVWISFSKIHQPTIDLVKINTHKDAVTKPSLKKIATDNQQLAVRKDELPIIKKERKKTVFVVAVANRKKVNPSEENIDSTMQQARTSTDLLSTDTTATQPMAIASTIKKLKVIHINELNEPEYTAPQLTHNISNPPFPFRIGRAEIHGNNLKAIHTISFISLQTKPLTN